jgi:hypothetical protein
MNSIREINQQNDCKMRLKEYRGMIFAIAAGCTYTTMSVHARKELKSYNVL